MKTNELIEAAKKHSKLTFGQMAKELAVSQDRITEWKKGTFQPSAGVLAYFAEKAGLPVLETVAEIEEQFDPRFSHIWAKALGNLRAAGVAASVMCLPLIYSITETISSAKDLTSLYFSLGGRNQRPRLSARWMVSRSVDSLQPNI